MSTTRPPLQHRSPTEVGIAAARGLAKAGIRFVRARWKLLLLLFLGVGLPLLAFGALAGDVWRRGGIGWDAPIQHEVHRHATPGFDAAMGFISDIGHLHGVVPVAVLVVIGLLVVRRRGNALFFAMAVGGAGLLNQGAKLFFRRDRPELWLSPSPAPEHTYSFPSGHAMGSMALVAALAVLAWPTRWRWWAILLGGLFTVLVGFSRVYLGVHYPSDVVAGWSASLAWVLGVSQAAYGHLVKPRERATPAAAGPDPRPNPPEDPAAAG
ncbi:MAG TPA: phosphatase PAP2 family protein [Longimicrobium sp.]|nr:phosphatase PAP2 family protein [Longimicrobium sp.]